MIQKIYFEKKFCTHSFNKLVGTLYYKQHFILNASDIYNVNKEIIPEDTL